MPELVPLDTCPHCGQPMPKPPGSNERKCELASCGRTFEPLDHKQRFCTPNCRLRAHRAKPRSSGPRVLTPDERRARVDATIPANTPARKIEAEKRTFPMFDDRQGPTVPRKTTQNKAETRGLPKSSSSSAAGGNADETQQWVRRVSNDHAPCAHTMRFQPPKTNVCEAVCGYRFYDGHSEAPKEMHDCPMCANNRAKTGELRGLKYADLDAVALAECAWRYFKDISSGEKWASVGAMNLFFLEHAPWNVLPVSTLYELLDAALVILVQNGSFFHDVAKDRYLLAKAPPKRKRLS